MHMLFPRDRERASPYHPSDRRFLDPILIDVLDDADLPRDETLTRRARRARARIRRRLGDPARRLSPRCGRQARGARSAARGLRPRCRAARPDDPLVAELRAFVEAGRRGLAALRGLPGDRGSGGGRGLARSGRRRCATAKPRRSSRRSSATRRGVRVRALLPVARRPPARAGRASARAGRPRDRLLSRSRGRRRAGRRGGLGACRARSREGVTVGAPPDPFSAAGAELEPARAQSARRRARGLGLAERALRRQHAPRRHAAHRPRDGPAAAVPHPRGRASPPTAPISPIRSTISSATSRSKASAPNAWWSARTSARCPRASATG